MNNSTKVECLIVCIRTLIEKNRCSLSEEDIDLLKECIVVLEKLDKDDENDPYSKEKIWNKVMDVTKILIKFFELSSLFGDNI
jgi:hypothetical protein